MKLVRYGPAGSEKPGLIDNSGVLRELGQIIDDIDGPSLAPDTLARLGAIEPSSLPPVSGEPRLGVPLNGIGKIIGIGLNYADHAAEANMGIPEEPILFAKQVTSLNGPHDPVMMPRDGTRVDWEVELAVVIGSRASYITEDAALDHVAGYCVVNDVSERVFQFKRGPDWQKGKSCNSFCPLGPWLVTADEVADPQGLRLWLNVNGESMQDGSTSRMIFSVAHLISYISDFMTLMPGDVIITVVG